MKVHLVVNMVGRNVLVARCSPTLRPPMAYQTRDITHVSCKNCLARWHEELAASLRKVNAKTIAAMSPALIQAMSK